MKAFAPKRIAAAACIAAAGLALYSFSTDDRLFRASKNLEVFNAVFKELDMFYVDTIDPDKTIKAGIDAMLMQLDPYTVYFPEEEMGDFQQMVTGKYGGIGSLITFHKRENRVAIAEPFEGSPADKAGLRAGDILLEIDGQDLEGKRQDEVSKMLRGEIGTSFLLKVRRPGQKKPLEVKITRENIAIDPVPYYGLMPDSAGYIVLTSFTDNCAQKVRQAVIDLKEQGAKSLILDLRGNGGGILDEAVQIVNLFVPKGREVLSTRGKVAHWDRTYTTPRLPLDTVMPLAVLVNSASASASEIVAGALQDLDRAVIVGQRTFGKGLVQTGRELPYNGSLKVTTAKYYIPSGRCIQAIDYAHRNDDGSVGRIPDSLTHVFRTATGRPVRDGGGISPDREVKPARLPNILYYLVADNLIFDFATDYALRHPHGIAPAGEFTLEPEEYALFKEKVKGAGFKYDQQSDKILKELKEVAEFEGYMDSARVEFEALEKRLVHDLDRDLDHFAPQIQRLIADEIMNRYYYQRGAIRQQLRDDEEVAEAAKVLADTALYRQLLAPPAEKPEGEDEPAAA